MGPGYSADQSALVAHLNRVVPQDLRLNSGRLPDTMKAQWSLLVSYHSSNFQDSFWLSTLIRRASTDLRHSMGAIWCHGTSMHAERDMQHTQHSPQVAVQHRAHPKETYVILCCRHAKSQPKSQLAFNSNIWNFQVLNLEVFLPSKDPKYMTGLTGRTVLTGDRDVWEMPLG